MDQRQLSMKPDDTIAKVKDTFVTNLGRDMDQKFVRDERGFIIDSNRHGEPLTAFSSKCNLNLDFTYEDQRVRDWAVSKALFHRGSK